MNRIQLQRSLERLLGVLVVTQVQVKRSQKIVRIGIVGIELHGVLHIPDCQLRIARAKMQNSQAVPGARIVRIHRRSLFQGLFGLRQLAQIHQRNPLVHHRNRARRIGRMSLFELGDCLLGQLLIHQRHADVVQARSFHRIRLRIRSPHRRCTNTRAEDQSKNQKLRRESAVAKGEVSVNSADLNRRRFRGRANARGIDQKYVTFSPFIIEDQPPPIQDARIVVMKRKIAVVTSSRADYSHLYWPLHDLAAHPAVDLQLIAMGPHLSPAFGSTVQEIERDGFPIAGRVECLLSSDTDIGMAKTIGVAVLGLADLLGNLRPDLLLLIADRYEMLAPASVALALRIPIAHIEGGEISEGAIDDAVRNALTKMSHIHFTSTHNARARVIAMGEEPWRVHRAGAPSLDHLRRSPLLTRDELQQKLGLDLSQPTILVVYHPVTLLRDTTAEADALFEASEPSSRPDSLQLSQC